MRYRLKPSEFDAWQYDGTNARELSKTLNMHIATGKLPFRAAEVVGFINRDGNGVILQIGDWLVRDQLGNVARQDREVFDRVFEPIEEPS